MQQMIWAVIRSGKAREVFATLKQLGVLGCTVSSVRGFGKEWRIHEPETHGELKKIEIVIEGERSQEVLEAIAHAAWTGLDGDGLLTVHDLKDVIEIGRLPRGGRASPAP